MGREAGLSETRLEALHRYATSGVFSPEERLVLELADTLTTAPTDVSDEMFARLRATFSERQIVELASAIAWENYRARMNRVFDVGSEDYAAGAFCPLPLRNPERGPADRVTRQKGDS